MRQHILASALLTLLGLAVQAATVNDTANVLNNTLDSNLFDNENATAIYEQIIADAQIYKGAFLNAPNVNLNKNKNVAKKLSKSIKGMPLITRFNYLTNTSAITNEPSAISNVSRYFGSYNDSVTILMQQFQDKHLFNNIRDKKAKATLFSAILAVINLCNDHDLVIQFKKQIQMDKIDYLDMEPNIILANVCSNWVLANCDALQKPLTNVKQGSRAVKANEQAAANFANKLVWGMKYILDTTITVAASEKTGTSNTKRLRNKG